MGAGGGNECSGLQTCDTPWSPWLGSGESAAHILNSKPLLVRRQEQDTDPTSLHPPFPLLVLLPLVEIGVLPANPDSAKGRDGVRMARVS